MHACCRGHSAAGSAAVPVPLPRNGTTALEQYLAAGSNLCRHKSLPSYQDVGQLLQRGDAACWQGKIQAGWPTMGFFSAFKRNTNQSSATEGACNRSLSLYPQKHETSHNGEEFPLAASAAPSAKSFSYASIVKVCIDSLCFADSVEGCLIAGIATAKLVVLESPPTFILALSFCPIEGAWTTFCDHRCSPRTGSKKLGIEG